MKSEKSNNIDMNKRNLKKLSKSQLIKLLLKQEKKPEIIVVDDTKQIDKPKIKQKKVYNHDNLFNDNPFPNLVVTNDPIKRTMKKVNKQDKNINEQTALINDKYSKLVTKDREKSTQLSNDKSNIKSIP